MSNKVNTLIEWVVLVCLLSSVASAQTQGQASMLLGRACGPDSTQFAVHQMGPQPVPPQPSASKSRIVIFMDIYSLASGCRHPIRVGVDGKWVAASCLGSYVSADIDPGEHHLCANAESKKSAKFTALYGFTAEAGKAYYFRVQIIDSSEFNVSDTIPVYMDTINEDEGRLLLAVKPASESKVK